MIIRYHLKSGKTLDVKISKYDNFRDFANNMMKFDANVFDDHAIYMGSIEYFEEIKDGD